MLSGHGKLRQAASRVVPKATAELSATPLVNREQLASLCAAIGIDKLSPLLLGFGEEAELLLAVLRRSLESGDRAELRGTAHALKGMAGNFGATRIAETAALLMDAATADDSPAGLVTALTLMLPATVMEMEAFCQ